MSDELKVINREDETPFGFDVTEDGRRVWYFIQADIFGDGRCLAIWNPSNRLQSYRSFKEALTYLAVAEEKKMFAATKFLIVRSFGEYDIRNITVIE
jgi:hypothetical protein